MNLLKLPRYSLLSILLRIIVVSIIAVAHMQLLILILELLDKNSNVDLLEYSILIIGFNIIVESNLALDLLYKRLFPLPQKLNQRMIVQFSVGVIILMVLSFILISLLPYKLESENIIFSINLVIGLVLINGMSSRLILYNITDQLIHSEKQIAQLKQEKLKLDYLNLQDKLDPHFLFNNLTILKSLAYHKNEYTVPFIENFTDIYRYVLQSSDKQLVTINEEIEFIESFLDLHKIRIGEGLKIKIDINNSVRTRKISPLTLQLLVENSLKHNIVSKSSPLNIKIYTEEDFIVVDNNIRKKQSTYSTKMGLENLRMRYEFLTEKLIIFDDTNNHFTVKVPLL